MNNFFFSDERDLIDNLVCFVTHEIKTMAIFLHEDVRNLLWEKIVVIIGDSGTYIDIMI